MHMKTRSAVAAVCSICGEPLTANGECLACLLRAGLDKPAEEAVSFDSLGFGDFEIARREDGSFWELGWGAMGVTYRATDKVLARGSGGGRVAPSECGGWISVRGAAR